MAGRPRNGPVSPHLGGGLSLLQHEAEAQYSRNERQSAFELMAGGVGNHPGGGGVKATTEAPELGDGRASTEEGRACLVLVSGRFFGRVGPWGKWRGYQIPRESFINPLLLKP